MTNDKLYESIVASIRKDPRDEIAYSDLTDLLKTWSKENEFTPYEKASEVLFIQNVGLKLCLQEERYEKAEVYRQMMYRTLLFSAPKNFDHFIQAMEFDREPQSRFYLPRRDVLLGHVKALQDLADDKLDELFLSQPPRTGKSTVVMFYYGWRFGQDSEKSNLYVSVTDDLTKTFYKRMLEMLTDEATFKYRDIFPSANLVDKDGEKETIDIQRKKGYPTLTCRSLYGSLNGSCDCQGTLVCDDLLTGIEEARNPSRLQTAQTTVSNNVLSRAKGNAKILWIGTRWSLKDPIGNRIRALETNEDFRGIRYKVINIPALNEKEESNFDYRYGVGFTTEKYRQIRADFESNNDIASWNAQYMGEPIEREGTVFTPDTMRYYNGKLPENEVPLRAWAVCDPAFGGGDYAAAVLVYTYNKLDNYVHDVMFSNADKSVTCPMLAKKLQRLGITTIDIEVSKTSRSYAEELSKQLDKIGYRCTIVTHVAPQNTSKEIRIYDKAPDIRAYFLFRDRANRPKEYKQFMQNIFSFTVEGKNQHDDAPDVMAMAAERMQIVGKKTIEIVQRPF